MNYNFHINDFEGPLDLLLHLVKASKMDIYEIETNKIIDDYLIFIKSMEKLNIDIASEYLVMAAELIHLKSKMLINKKDEEESDYEINSEEDLKIKLIEYQKYKEITNEFKKLEENRNDFYTKIPANLNEFIDDNHNYNNNGDAINLYEALLQVYERLKKSKPLNTKITKKELSIEKRIGEVRNILKKKKKMNFIDLFDIMNKEYIVVTFLSILEMSKNKEVIISQEKNFGNIVLEIR